VGLGAVASGRALAASLLGRKGRGRRGGRGWGPRASEGRGGDQGRWRPAGPIELGFCNFSFFLFF
jgi:hypothetical protein